MPTLFMSYKREDTAAIAPLRDRLRAARYRVWFDTDDIHLGDDDWRAQIDLGLNAADAMILCLSPAACESIHVQYEVEQMRTLGKRIFPVIVARLDDLEARLRQVGLPERQQIEDFTDGDRYDEKFERLLDALKHHGHGVTRHDLRHQRGTKENALHQRYLAKLIERIGTLPLSALDPNQANVPLERVYVDSPTALTLSVEVKDWRIVDWWIDRRDTPRQQRDELEPTRQKPADLGYEKDALELRIADIEAEIRAEEQKHREQVKENVSTSSRPRLPLLRRWRDGTKNNVRTLEIQDIAAARDRLVILGAPGSGKSTFVRHLALCLAGEQLAGGHEANLSHLPTWTHGPLTPIYIELRRFVASELFPPVGTMPTTDHLWRYIETNILGPDLADYADDLRLDLQEGRAVLILDGLDEVPYPQGRLGERQGQLQGLAAALNEPLYRDSRVIVASRPHAYAGWQLPGFEAVTIADFTDGHRIELAARLYQVANLDDEAAREKAKRLNQELRRVNPELKDRPLFLTLMATIFLEGEAEGLPTRPGALYRRSILLLLDRWTQTKPGAPTLTDLLGAATADDLYQRLAELAYQVHDQYGDKPGTPEIPAYLLESCLMRLGRKSGADPLGLYTYLSENAGVIVSPGQDDERDVFRFAHRTFQEYLSAAHITRLCLEADSFDKVCELIEAKPQTWREPCLLVGDVLVDLARSSDLWDLLDDLLDDAPDSPLPAQRSGEGPGVRANDPRWWSIWLACALIVDQNLHQIEKLSRPQRAVQEGLIDWLRVLVRITPLPPVERATCAALLGHFGADDRPGIGFMPSPLAPLPQRISGKSVANSEAADK